MSYKQMGLPRKISVAYLEGQFKNFNHRLFRKPTILHLIA